ncbi:MAG: 3-phosphoshikimate 1-carboxyvinyltransferase [Nitrospirae bacterium]|nr:3-phosphoshikimate 1-carboxyvinyltransferase [Nitrospirota bacterium]
MNRISIKYKGPLRGEITTPPDKSISHRAIMFSSLAEGQSIVRNFLQAEDPLRTLEAFKQMGIQIEHRTQNTEHRLADNEIIIHGKGLNGLSAPQDIIDCGNSGTTMRLLCGVLAGQPFSTALTGDSSLRSRPMKRVITPLTEMGAVIESENGFPPLRIKGGKLTPISYKSPVASAQVKSAIMLAGLYCEGVTTVIEPGKSRDHTERMLKACGVDISLNDLEVSVRGVASLKPMEITVPGDLSSAAFFIVAGLLVPGSEILIRNTGINPTRSGLIDVLNLMGARIKLENERLVSGEPVADLYVKHSQLKGIDIGGDLILRAIDEFPVLCVAAAKAEGTTRITGAKELRVKESDRIASMATELRKMDVKIEELEDGLIIEGREDLKPAAAVSYGDHRIAMSMLIAGLTASGETTVEDTDCVNTSFPGFMDMLKGLGA